MSLPLHALIAVLGCALISVPASGASGQSSFQTSLTATISRLAPEGATPRSDSLGCRQISLHWRELSGANRYVVYVSTTGREPWVALPPENACGSSGPAGLTTVMAVEPTTDASSGTRRIYYKVVALGGGGSSGSGERTLDTTTVVLVELR